ncbi:hypothetical protein GTA08_BOTSDO07222 [Botryosphaeria dothidea]|uniref:Uncharacterized protein n=1 Tax=Botryosphaeria dothidea TaxID=55169 RepID=A0A8H4IQX1_9PEZI|nr:hypothetical protein GTA08_BOTSDO07222 [Botryosphaeria dothidea]
MTTTTTGHVLGLGPYRLAQLFSATSLAFFFGASSYSSISVMPSLIDAPTHMILRGNAIIPPALLSAIANLAYLAYSAPLQRRDRHISWPWELWLPLWAAGADPAEE